MIFFFFYSIFFENYYFPFDFVIRYFYIIKSLFIQFLSFFRTNIIHVICIKNNYNFYFYFNLITNR